MLIFKMPAGFKNYHPHYPHRIASLLDQQIFLDSMGSSKPVIVILTRNYARFQGKVAEQFAFNYPLIRTQDEVLPYVVYSSRVVAVMISLMYCKKELVYSHRCHLPELFYY
jgi:hypothetical protein